MSRSTIVAQRNWRIIDTKKSLFALISSAIIVVGVLINTAAVNQINLRGEGITSYDGKTEQFVQTADWEQDDRDISVYIGDLPPSEPDSNSFSATTTKRLPKFCSMQKILSRRKT